MRLDAFIGVLKTDDEEPWRARANCRGTSPHLFYGTDSGDVARAQAVCHGCEVQAECLEWAMENQERFGTWGGMSQRQRHHVRMGRPVNTRRDYRAEEGRRIELRVERNRVQRAGEIVEPRSPRTGRRSA